MNSSSVGHDLRCFQIADHINHAGLTFGPDARTSWYVDGDINSIRPFTHGNLVSGNDDISRLDQAASRGRLQARLRLIVLGGDYGNASGAILDDQNCFAADAQVLFVLLRE